MFVILPPQPLPFQDIDVGNGFRSAGAEFIASY